MRGEKKEKYVHFDKMKERETHTQKLLNKLSYTDISERRKTLLTCQIYLCGSKHY